MEKITELTPEDYKLMEEIKNKYINMAVDTKRANRPKAEDAICRIYVQAGLAPPKHFIWVDSPLEALMANVYYENDKMHPDKVAEAVKKTPIETYKKRASELRSFHNYINYGYQEVSWLGFYDFFRQKGVDGLEKIDAFIDLAQEAGWWWSHEEVAIVSEKFVEVYRDPNGELHNEEGPAVIYNDNVSKDNLFYFWHGLDIPAWFIKDREKITFERIKEENNQELRRVLTDIYGRDRFLKDIGASVIDRDEHYGNLWIGREEGGDEPLAYVEVFNSTYEGSSASEYYERLNALEALIGDQKDQEESELEKWAAKQRASGNLFRRVFFLRVPPTMKTAHEAVAWTFFETPETYNPDVEA